MTFGQRIRDLRLTKFTKPLPVRHVAKELRISHPYLIQLEQGTETPSLELAKRIAEFFGEDETELISLARNIKEKITELTSQFPQQALQAVGSFKRDLFLSHRHVDKPWVRRLAERLKSINIGSNAISVWFDEAEIKPGKSITGQINDGLESSRHVALIMTPDYFESASGWTDAEWQSALYADPVGRHSRVIPLLVKDCPYVPALLKHLGLLDFRHTADFETSLLRLVSLLRGEQEPTRTSRGQLIAPGGTLSSQTMAAERSIDLGKPDPVTEDLPCNLLPVLSLPEFIWVAPIARQLRKSMRGSITKNFIKAEIQDWFLEHPSENPYSPAFLLREDSILSFHDLQAEDGPFASTVEPFRGKRYPVGIWCSDENHRRTFVQMVNMSIARHCRRVGLVTSNDDKKRRYFYPALEPLKDVTVHWRSGARPRTVTKFNYNASNEVTFCRHLAVELPLVLLGPKYYLQIKPTWIFTKDGTEHTLLTGPRVSSLAMRWTGRERNLQILYHTRFWAYVLSQKKSTVRIHAGDQLLQIDSNPAFIRLPFGITDDRANLESLIYRMNEDIDWKTDVVEFDVPEVTDEA